MKNMKKILALVIAALMIAGMMSAFAAPTTNNSLTINDSRTDRTYTAYQILTGDISGSEGENGAAGYTLADIHWGADSGKNGALTKAEVEALPAYNATRAQIDTYISALTLGTGTEVPWDATAHKYILTGLTSGWYYVVDSTDVDGENDFQSAFLTEVVGAATATPKGSTTTVEKKVDDINDTTQVAELERDSADHDIGDTITFTLTATLGSDLTDYQTYELIFCDNLSKGLTYQGLTSLKIDGTAKETSNITVTDGSWVGSTTPYTDGTVKTFTINDVLALGAAAGSTVEIKYTAQLNSNAIVGAAGNPNKVILEYSNNPDNTSHGKTGEDYNKVFTFKVDINKVDPDLKPLAGAQFTLYKEVPSTYEGAQTGAAIKTALAAVNASIKADALADAKSYIVIERKTVNANGDEFDFKGIDDGTYVLVENEIPTGYNAWDAIEFEVTATHTDGATEEAIELTDLSGGDEFSGSKGTVVLADGQLAKTIVNESGTQLPSTGGIGTTLFYVGGGILVLAAVILLVTKRRMNAND